jgi:hypothetical protein
MTWPDLTGTQPQDPLAGTPDAFVLDNAAWASLTGPHAPLAEINGSAARYPSDVSPFAALSPDGGDQR